YADALELAEDLHRFQAGEPIQARPVGRAERLIKWVRRRPAPATAYGLGVLVLLLVTSAVGVLRLWRHAESARQDAAAARYYHAVNLALREWHENELARAEQLLQVCPAMLRGWEWHYVRRLCHSELVALKGHTDRVLGVAYSPDGRHLAS